MSARLVVSLSGIGARTLHRCAELAGELDRRGVLLSLLFAPRVGGQEQSPAVVDWVRQRRVRGDALLLHGFDYVEGRRLIARRTEFGAFPAHEAGLRLTAANRLMERLGLAVDSFAAPRWTVSDGTLKALRQHGFALCAGSTAVHDLRTGSTYKGRVRSLASVEFALALGVARAVRRGGLVRLGVDAADLVRAGPRQAILDAVDLATQHGAEATTYSGIIPWMSLRSA
jgi:predicted deacetylase